MVPRPGVQSDDRHVLACQSLDRLGYPVARLPGNGCVVCTSDHVYPADHDVGRARRCDNLFHADGNLPQTRDRPVLDQYRCHGKTNQFLEGDLSMSSLQKAVHLENCAWHDLYSMRNLFRPGLESVAQVKAACL